MKTVQRLLGALVLAASSCVSGTRAGAPAAPPNPLQVLMADEWAARLRDDPLLATQSDVHEYDHLLPSATRATYERQFERDRRFQDRLTQMDRALLSARDQVNYDLFAFVLHHRLALAPFRTYRIPVTSDEGFHVEVMRMAAGVAMNQTRDYENYLARLHAIPSYFDEQIVNMRQGMADGFTLPAAVLPGIIAVLTGQQYTAVEKTPFFEPFQRFPVAVAAPDRERLRDLAKRAIENDVIPAYRKLLAFVANEYRAKARATVGASTLPDGPTYYEALVKYFTNLDVTPEHVHHVGVDEVARIRVEMDAVIRQTDFHGTFAEFLEHLRTDPQFYAKSPAELLEKASTIAKEIDGILPTYFGKLPREPYSIQPVPDELAPNYTGGRYVPAPRGGTKGGEYWVNTYALEKRPLYALTALTLHEAVPGHHLQAALAHELTDVPPFRLDFYPHAFGEGWGLYAEKLGVEMNLYKTPYDHFGRLSYEMWRACRLVVDTGLHVQGWSRERALEYLASHTALSTQEVRTEIDRYIAWPGQALAYKMGELKIVELRGKAKRLLGGRFDIRAFHDAVLGQGGVPLPILERQIDAYIAAAVQH
ncbi:MAG TPA: DUF885 domain-containing protein [Polyangiaceae bacterium]|nr:DUF885 domain-containing protein [Polyangiaceae bacterium]